MPFVKSISKSQFTTSLQCKKAFWLSRNRSDLKVYDPGQLKRMEAGTHFGILMQECYPGGIMIPDLDNSFKGKIENTSIWLANHERPIYEATLSAGFQGLPLLCMVDILVPEPEGWSIVEVKSSTSVKEEHIPDAAFQLFVAEKMGLDIKKVGILHVNNQYVRQGPIDVDELGTLSDITSAARELQGEIAKSVEDLEELVFRSDEPEVLIGPHCDVPYECGFKSYCWKDIPTPSVFDLFSRNKAHLLYSRGYVTLAEVPEDANLTWREKRRWKQSLKNEVYFDQEAIEGFLKNLEYPLYYLDFETFNPVIPEFNGTRPYQQIPFQFSLHFVESRSSEPRHVEYLAEADGVDPRPEFLRVLIKELGRSGSIITYNAAFEKARLKELAEDFPEHHKKIDRIIERVVDLLVPFRNVDVYHPEMGGSASIKNVLPALVPDLAYDGLAISNGQEAMDAFKAMLDGEWLGEDLEQKRKELLAYCELDTLAMVRLVEYLDQEVR